MLFVLGSRDCVNSLDEFYQDFFTDLEEASHTFSGISLHLELFLVWRTTDDAIMPFHSLSFCQWVIMMNQILSRVIILDRKVSPSLLGSAQIFLGCFVFDDEHFQHLPCINLSAAKFSDDHHNSLY